MFLDDTACNLASLNLIKYVDSNGQFDREAYKYAVDVTITAQEYTSSIRQLSHAKIAGKTPTTSAAGLGYANLGALLMSMSLPYDSNGGRRTLLALFTRVDVR